MDDLGDVKGTGADPPSARVLSTAGGYSQIYIVRGEDLGRSDSKANEENESHEVFFRCGNWSYVGRIQFGQLKMCTSDLPVLVPALQKQQGSLRYYCHSSNVPKNSEFSQPLDFIYEAVDFFAREMVSDGVEKEIKKMASVFSWINDDSAATYFELGLVPDLPSYMDSISLIAAKTYTRGLVIITIFAEGCLYFVLASGEGDQALLDVRFPDVSKHGQGLHLASYPFPSPAQPYRKLILWHAISGGGSAAERMRELPRIKTLNVSSRSYEQTYCIMRSSWDGNSATLSVHHDVLFRFGSWCYSGRVQLIPTIALSDLPFIIPALRIQQSRLDYLCDTASVPTTSPFAGALAYVNQHGPLLEGIIANAEDALMRIMDQLRSKGDALEAERMQEWLSGEPADTFFEFATLHDQRAAQQLKNIELIASKVYHASGIITLSAYFDGCIYVTVQDGSKENPLLDSRFPDFSGKGRGVQIATFKDAEGEPGSRMSPSSSSHDSSVGSTEAEAERCQDWPGLKRVSVWQTKAALERVLRAAQPYTAIKSRTASDESLAMSAKDSSGGAGSGAGVGRSDADHSTELGDRSSIDDDNCPGSDAQGKGLYNGLDAKDGGKHGVSRPGGGRGRGALGATAKGREGYEEWDGDDPNWDYEIAQLDASADHKADEKSSSSQSQSQGARSSQGPGAAGRDAMREGYLRSMERKLTQDFTSGAAAATTAAATTSSPSLLDPDQKLSQSEALRETSYGTNDNDDDHDHNDDDGFNRYSGRPRDPRGTEVAAAGSYDESLDSRLGMSRMLASESQVQNSAQSRIQRDYLSSDPSEVSFGRANEQPKRFVSQGTDAKSPDARGGGASPVGGNSGDIESSRSSGLGSMGRGLGFAPLGGTSAALNALSEGGGLSFGGGLKMARPHHLPKMAIPDSLSKKMEDIKRSMGGEEGQAAWDTTTGRPLAQGRQQLSGSEDK